MPTQFKDYYKILQVDPSAEPEVIAAAYKRLALKYHPDTNKSPDAPRRMQEINMAYKVLGNPQSRAKYDRERTSYSSSFEEERRRQEAAYRRTEYERGRNTQAEAEQHRAKYERQQREQSEAAQRQAEYERQQRVKAEAEKQVKVANTKIFQTPLVALGLGLSFLFLCWILGVGVTRLAPVTVIPQPTSVVQIPTKTLTSRSISVSTMAYAGPWLSAGSMTTARDYHTATLLPDGRVLLTAGRSASSPEVSLSSAEIYDPVSGTFRAIVSLNTARQLPSATLLPDGRVLVIGGYKSSQGWLSSAEIYDPAIGQWNATQPIFAHGVVHTATLLKDGRVLVMAGYNQSGSPGPDDRVELFDPKTNRWQQAALHKNTEGSHTATLLSDGRVLIAGGLADPAIYDPASNTWQPAGKLAVQRCESQAVLLQDGRVLLIGGYICQEETFINGVEVYDSVGNTWQQTAPLAQARYQHTATLLPDGRV